VPRLRKNGTAGHDSLSLRCYRMEINVEETNVMISKELLPVQLKTDQK
jgi:hypothetical protein